MRDGGHYDLLLRAFPGVLIACLSVAVAAPVARGPSPSSRCFLSLTRTTVCWLLLRNLLRRWGRCQGKANDDGASRWCSFPHAGGFSTAVRIGSKPVSSRPYSF